MSIDSIIIVIVGSIVSLSLLALAWRLWTSAMLLEFEHDRGDEPPARARHASPPPPPPSPLPAEPRAEQDFERAQTKFFLVPKGGAPPKPPPPAAPAKTQPAKAEARPSVPPPPPPPPRTR